MTRAEAMTKTMKTAKLNEGTEQFLIWDNGYEILPDQVYRRESQNDPTLVQKCLAIVSYYTPDEDDYGNIDEAHDPLAGYDISLF